MKLNIELNFEQILQIISQLPMTEKDKLLRFLQREKTVTPNNELQSLLLNGPTMTDKQYQNYLLIREELNKVGTNVID